ncbi:hypothetical protein [Mechercharimyces sp. CAU 1602]|uniref:hypothetical protein n=1 Tax=Mechercharimyces sp. CAU 1602 TaxID=2973933 RepID=UPI002161A04D|nr:hypothetical protein [Mechercharimyces sp. CAU 1602]MCS1352175.1 hypothetical protein [Mechercharimyces sp. CAU 1602]
MPPQSPSAPGTPMMPPGYPMDAYQQPMMPQMDPETMKYMYRYMKMCHNMESMMMEYAMKRQGCWQGDWDGTKWGGWEEQK